MNGGNSMAKRLKHILTKNRGSLLIIFLCLIALAFKLALLFYRKVYIDPDEGYYLLLARNIIAGAGYGFNGLPNIVFPPLLPCLIAAVNFVVSELRAALGLITAFSGAALGVAAYLMMRKKDFSVYPVLAGAFVLFIPALNDFIPQTKAYTQNLYRGSEILNALLVLTALFFLMRALKTKRARFAIGAGIILGLAYLTRPEGFLIFVLLTGWLMVLALFRFISLSPKKILLFACAFLLVAAPYILYLKTTTGQWMLSGKVGASQSYRESLMTVIRNEDWRPFSNIHYSLDQKTWEMNDAYWGYHPELEFESGLSRPDLVRNAVENLRFGWTIPRTIFPVYLWVLAIPGLVIGLRNIRRRNTDSDVVLMALFPYSLLILALTYPIPRHHLFLTPVLCIYAVRGLEWISSSIRRRLESRKGSFRSIPAISGLIVLLLFAGAYLKNFNHSALHNPDLRTMLSADAGISQYISEHGGGVVMSGHPGIAVRARTDWQVLPQAALTVALKFATQKNAGYIVWRYGNSRDPVYLLIDVKKSYIPGSADEKITHEILDRQPLFQLVRMLPLTGPDK